MSVPTGRMRRGIISTLETTSSMIEMSVMLVISIVICVGRSSEDDHTAFQ